MLSIGHPRASMRTQPAGAVPMATTITSDVADILSRATIAGTLLRLPDEKLDRTLYQKVDKVLTSLGGKWNRKQGGHVFDADPSARLENGLGKGSVVSRAQTLQFFETPDVLADDLVSRLDVRPDDVCLEPSAGRGRIVAALGRAGATDVTAIEIDADNMAAIMRQGIAIRLLEGDFLAIRDHVAYDVIAMNPPFRGNQDIRHVRHAWSLLRPGGRLGAIVSEHAFFGREREAEEWRVWLAEIGAQHEIVSAGTFKDEGTLVQTRLIVIRKPA
jgi:SAM-dependent methyltransferase